MGCDGSLGVDMPWNHKPPQTLALPKEISHSWIIYSHSVPFYTIRRNYSSQQPLCVVFITLFMFCTFIVFSICIIIYVIINTFELLNSPICLPNTLSTYFKHITCHPLMKASKANRPHTWVIRGKQVAISSAEQV